MNPGSTGIGLRAPHYVGVLETLPALDFLEVHAENFFHAGGAAMHTLQRARLHYPISLHGVGLSLASADVLAARHLDKLAALVERVEPALISEHLCWGAVDGVHLNDLLPFPYCREALDVLAERVERVQERLGRRILVENLSAYVQFRESEMSECAFLAELSRRSGCGVLLDVNNLYVNARNFGFDARAEMMWLLDSMPSGALGEVHLAGHRQGESCLIDTHDGRVCEEVWSLYRDLVAQHGPVPTLVEWDADLPALEVLLEEARIAKRIMRNASLGVDMHEH